MRHPADRAGPWATCKATSAARGDPSGARPAFSLTVVLTLASGLGLTSAVFAFADGYLFRPIPFGDPQELYLVRAPDQRSEFLRASEAEALRASPVGRYGFVDGERSSPVGFVMLELGGRQVPVLIGGIGEGFGEVTRVKLAFGRYFTPEDHRVRETVPVWLTHRFFVRELGGDPDILGRRYVARAGARAMTIEVVGVTDPSVTTFNTKFGANNQLAAGFAPALPMEPDSGRFVTLATPIVRLPPDVRRERAEAEIAAALQAIRPGPGGTLRRVRLDSLQQEHGKAGRTTARLLMIGAALAMALVLVNLVHLLLTRGVARSAEIATRAALGASRWRLTRLFLVESLMYGAVGVATGLVLARWLTTHARGELADARNGRRHPGARVDAVRLPRRRVRHRGRTGRRRHGRPLARVAGNASEARAVHARAGRVRHAHVVAIVPHAARIRSRCDDRGADRRRLRRHRHLAVHEPAARSRLRRSLWRVLPGRLPAPAQRAWTG